MKPLRPFQAIYIIGILIFATSFRAGQENKVVVYKPSRDFSFLTTYHCIYDIFSEEQWTKNTGRSFDNKGVHLTNNQYHPVNACHYALFCYDEYKKTGEERLKKAFLAQVSYLRDSTKYHEIEGYKVGYPYLTSFHDLVAPWYSALAQSEAISVLVRYYAMTKDETILPLIVKLKNFMIAPQTDGKGTMSNTPEGNIWFEEYPNSPQERQVLNGFFLALVALYDYNNLFPDDKETKDLYVRAIKSAKESIKFYDTGSWLKYNRGDQRLVANGYMKWQVLEMKLVYDITKDEFFHNLYILWSTYAYDKIFETPGCKMVNYNFSIPLTLNSKGILTAMYTPVPVKISKEIISVSASSTKSNSELTKLHDNNPNSFLRLFASDTTVQSMAQIEYDFKNQITINQINVRFFQSDSIYSDLNILYKTLTNDQRWKNLKQEKFKLENSNGSLSAFINPMTLQSLKLEFPDLKKEVRISEVQLFTEPDSANPEFYHFLTPILASENLKEKLTSNDINSSKALIFYKAAASKDSLSKITWSANNVLRAKNQEINILPGNYYQFLIVGSDLQGKVIKNFIGN